MSPAAPDLGERARGVEHGEVEAVKCSIEMEREHNSGWEELCRSAMAAVAMAPALCSEREQRASEELEGEWERGVELE
jgi:hypothetical protein